MFGKKLGFLETRTDVQGIMADIRFKIAYASIVRFLSLPCPHWNADLKEKVGQIPWLDKFIAKNPILVMLAGTHPIVKFTVDNMNERIEGKYQPKHRDFLARSFEAKGKYSDLVTDRIVRM